MSNENPTSTRVSAGALYDNTSAAGEYLFSVMMVMLAALGKALARLFAAIDRRLGWLGGKILSGLKILGEKIASPFRRYGMALRMGCADIRRAHADGIVPACIAGFRMVGRILFGKRGLAVTLCNWALPIISCVFLFSVVTYANSMTYALRLSVNGDLMGYVSDETVFTEAEKIVQQRITYLDSNTEMFSFNSDYTVEMVGYGSTMTKYQLADKMLQSMGAEISYAYGM